MTQPRIIIRLKRSLLTTAIVSMMLATAPMFAVLYWLSGSVSGIWIPVLVTHLALIVTGIALILRQFMVYTAVTDSWLIGNGMFSRAVSTRLDDIAEVLVVNTHVGLQSETVTQYLFRDAAGRTLYRLRGNFWHQRDIQALLNVIAVEPTRVARTMKLHALFRTYPGSAYWFEDRPWLQVLWGLAVVTIVGAMLVWAMTIVGIATPIAS